MVRLYGEKCIECANVITGNNGKLVKAVVDGRTGSYHVHQRCYKRMTNRAEEALKKMKMPITQKNINWYIRTEED